MPDLSQHQLEELVEGKPQTPRIVFYDKARMNVEKSKVAGHRVYDTFTYLKETQAGVTDWIPVKARPEHLKTYPEEYGQYLSHRRGEKSPLIDIIPNITPAEKQELIDYGLNTIRALAEAIEVPPHLELMHRNAKVLHAVFTEQKNASTEESTIEETNQLIGNGNARAGESTEEGSPTDLLSEANRLHHAPDVGQPIVPNRVAVPEREVTEGIRTGGRKQHRKGLIDSNWSIHGFTQ
jgi:hypothetical protein